MFDPAGGGVDLGKFFLRLGHYPQRGIKQDRAGRGGALVDGEDVGHQGEAFACVPREDRAFQRLWFAP
jgi:hypothetical protein